MKQLRYNMWGSPNEHPQTQMNKLGYNVIGSVPQSIGDQWWFTVEEIIYPLPKYLSEMQYNFEYWHNNCHKTCEHFKKNPCCCSGSKELCKELKKKESLKND